MAVMTGDIKTTETYNPALACAAQEKYCEQNNLPMFAPYSGYCWHCGQNIYAAKVYPNGHVGGISVEKASNSLVTGCPFCCASYCD